MQPTEISLEYLQSIGTAPYVHGNGFIQLQTNNGNGDRYHFWGHPDIPRQKVSTPIHDHVFSFRSTVIFGRMLNIRYKLRDTKELHVEGPLYQLYMPNWTHEHNTELTLLNTHEFWRLEVSGMGVIQEGQSYIMPAFRFHETYAPEPTMTLMEKVQSFESNFLPRIVVPGTKEPDNSFDRHGFGTNFLWELIEDILAYGDR